MVGNSNMNKTKKEK